MATAMELLRGAYWRVLAWWHPMPPPLPVMLPPLPPPLPAPPKLKEVIAARDDGGGEFYFRESILDQLDYYMVCIRRMQLRDPKAYEMFKRIGANLIPASMTMTNKLLPNEQRVSPWFRDTLPSFGAVFMGTHARDCETDDKNRHLSPRFMYFTKYHRLRVPPGMQRPRSGAVYVVTAFWDRPEDKSWKWGTPVAFPVVVDGDGNVHLLRLRVHERHRVRHRRGERRGEHSTVHRQTWMQAEPFMEEWATHHKLDVRTYLAGMFSMVSEQYETANASMIRVAATKGMLSAVFTVFIKRTPYFFKDRDLAVNENGRRKRIFHIVRPHRRVGGTLVKMHFRGSRRFVWNGYDIAITVPGRDHQSVTEFNVGAWDEAHFGRMKGDGLELHEVAEAYRQHMNGAPLTLRSSL